MGLQLAGAHRVASTSRRIAISTARASAPSHAQPHNSPVSRTKMRSRTKTYSPTQFHSRSKIHSREPVGRRAAAVAAADATSGAKAKPDTPILLKRPPKSCTGPMFAKMTQHDRECENRNR
jgi:hypothetical protein